MSSYDDQSFCENSYVNGWDFFDNDEDEASTHHRTEPERFEVKHVTATPNRKSRTKQFIESALEITLCPTEDYEEKNKRSPTESTIISPATPSSQRKLLSSPSPKTPRKSLDNPTLIALQLREQAKHQKSTRPLGSRKFRRSSSSSLCSLGTIYSQDSSVCSESFDLQSVGSTQDLSSPRPSYRKSRGDMPSSRRNSGSSSGRRRSGGRICTIRSPDGVAREQRRKRYTMHEQSSPSSSSVHVPPSPIGFQPPFSSDNSPSQRRYSSSRRKVKHLDDVHQIKSSMDNKSCADRHLTKNFTSYESDDRECVKHTSITSNQAYPAYRVGVIEVD